MAPNPGLRARFGLALLLMAGVLAGCDLRLNPSSLPVNPVRLPVTGANLSFDDMAYDSQLKKLIIPAAETGSLVLMDPKTRATDVVQGFSAQTSAANPVVGTTSAVTARGWIFALDHASLKLNVIDPAQHKIVGSAPVAADPDYIRYVPATNELWVTEKIVEQIEVFSLAEGNPPVVTASGKISVPNGPEALLIDQTRGLAYTNQPKAGTTAVIQVMTHGIIYEWGNGCSKARGMAEDEENGYLFVACNEGKVVVMDINNNGAQLTSQTYGGGLDFVAYNPRLQHLYLPSPRSALLAIFAVQVAPPATPAPGQTPTPTADAFGSGSLGPAAAVPSVSVSLVRLATADTALKAKCITVDENDNIWICDPNQGRLFVIHDSLPAASP